MDVRGSQILLTGATGGLGHAIARELAQRGARLLLTGRRAEVLEPLAAETGGRALPVDLGDPADVARLCAQAGEVDGLVANAALPGSGRLEGFSVEDIDRVLDVNLRAPIVLARTLVPGMLERRRGSLVFVSSLLGKAATAGSSVYAATKYGIRGFALALREDVHGSGVAVTTIFPGFIRDAGMFHESGTSLPPGVGTRPPEDVAAAVVRAIERGPAEIDVAPLTLRAAAKLSGLAPELSAAVARRVGAGDVAAQLETGQLEKR